MHGTGNDFVVAEANAGAVADAEWAALAIRLCDRHFGVGADGLILVLESARADFQMRIFNPDGSEPEMCGNGIRCFVKYVLDRGLIDRDAVDAPLTIETGAGILEARATRGTAGPDGLVTHVRVSMGTPALNPSDVGALIEQSAPVLDLPIEAAGEHIEVTLVSMGNPHAVAFLDAAPADYALERIGPAVEHHPLFANRTNFEVVRVRDRSHLDLRVWERGAGATLACGTGACAAVVASTLHGYVEGDVEVLLPGGPLRIEWDGVGPVYLSGPATFVFASEWTSASWEGPAL
ncbi:MAG: diaminopimelate epimerase [Dehalococcoidia bacterium]|nr:diaminopimelate epimerase [Dehalococcoidia bacterium]